MNSINTTARLGGLLYLINIVLGFFAIGYVPGLLIVSKDPIHTAQNILAHETLYRLSIAAHIVILLTNIPLALVFYRLFKPVSTNATLLVIFFTLVGTSIECANLINQFMPVLLSKANYLASLSDEQKWSLGYSFHTLQSIGENLALVFFGFYGICIGYLIYNSRFLPRFIGIMLTIGGSCYIINSFSNFIAPAWAAKLFPAILLPSGLAELTLCLWLLFAAVNANKWKQRSLNSPRNESSIAVKG